jgi:Caspase domain
MVSRCILFIASLLFLCGIANAAEKAEPRLALVIGNSNYRDVVALPNPAHDADAMAGFLTKAGFDVTRANDLSQSEMRRTLRDFADKIAKSGPRTEVTFYYAGHGAQIEGENFLIPVDAHIRRESDVAITSVRLNDVMNTLASVPIKSLVAIFDACRNNPFSAINKTIGRGLAIVDAPRGSIVSYATSPGATALDGDGDHSPFTTALLKVGSTPGLPVEQAFKEVRLEVAKATKDEQIPWESSSLVSNFSFVPGAGTSDTSGKPKDEQEHQPAAQTVPSVLTVASWKKKLANVSMEKAYDMVITANVLEGYEAFLTMHPKFRNIARIRMLIDLRLEMIAWYNATTLNDALSYEAFLVHYPNSKLAATAKRLLERAKYRSIPSNIMASANPSEATGSAPTAPKVITKVVEKPVVVTKIVEKPVVVTKIVKQVVQVPGPCECVNCGRRPHIRPLKLNEGRIHNPNFHPVQKQSMGLSIGGGMGFNRHH